MNLRKDKISTMDQRFHNYQKTIGPGRERERDESESETSSWNARSVRILCGHL